MDVSQLLDTVLPFFPEAWRPLIAGIVGTVMIAIAVLGAAKKAGLFQWKTLPPPANTLPPSTEPASQPKLTQDQLVNRVATGEIDLETARWLFDKIATTLDGAELAKAETAFVNTVQTIGAAPKPGEKDALLALAQGETAEALRILDSTIGPTNPEALQTLAAIAVPSNPHLAVQKFNEFASATTSRSLAREEKVVLSYSSPRFPNVTIGLVTGNIADIKNADAWVNSENDWLTMARMVESSISATIRFYSTRRDPDSAGDEIDQLPLNDPMQKALKPRPYGRVRPLPLGSIRITRSWGLKERNNVKRVLHVVSVRVRQLRGPELGPAPGDYVRDVMRAAEDFNRGFLRGDASKLRSMAIPLFGTGMAKIPVAELTDFFVEGLLQGVAAIASRNRTPTLREIRLVAFSTREFVPLRNSFEKRVRSGDLVAVQAPAAR